MHAERNEFTREKRRWLLAGLLVLLLCGILAATPAQAAGITGKKPTFKNTSVYTNGRVTLAWSKVSGATSYEIYRSSTKNGSYKKFATSKKTTLTKSATGAYYYKVRGVKGSSRSKFSDPAYLFSASGRITNVTFNGGWGYAGTYGTIASIEVKNRTGQPMNFLGMSQGYFYLVDRTTGQVVDKVYAQLNTNNDAYGISISAGITIPAKKTQTIWVSSMTYTLWTTYSSDPGRYQILITLPFYPGKGSSKAIPMAIAATESASDFAIAANLKP